MGHLRPALDRPHAGLAFPPDPKPPPCDPSAELARDLGDAEPREGRRPVGEREAPRAGAVFDVTPDGARGALEGLDVTAGQAARSTDATASA